MPGSRKKQSAGPGASVIEWSGCGMAGSVVVFLLIDIGRRKF